MTQDAELKRAVADEYLCLAELLEKAGKEAWDAPSLCEGWRVREVVAHVTMPVRYDQAAFMAELERCGFDFTRLSNEVAARDASLPEDELLGQLRDESLHRWEPPDGGVAGALNHAVIHSLDITLALGAPRLSSDQTMRAVLDALAVGGKNAYFGTDISGRRFVASDLDWTYGSGAELRGSAGALAAAICGRAVPGLVGAPLARTPGEAPA